MADPTRHAVYPGSFDPFHLGHENIVRRAANLFDELTVAVGYNPQKAPATMPAEDRVRVIGKVLADLPNVRVVSFTGLAVRFVRQQGAKFMVRGIRALADMQGEFTMSLTNASMAPEIDTIFLMSSKEYTHISSTLIRQIIQHGGELAPFLPPAIIEQLAKTRAARG